MEWLNFFKASSEFSQLTPALWGIMIHKGPPHREPAHSRVLEKQVERWRAELEPFSLRLSLLSKRGTLGNVGFHCPSYLKKYRLFPTVYSPKSPWVWASPLFSDRLPWTSQGWRTAAPLPGSPLELARYLSEISAALLHLSLGKTFMLMRKTLLILWLHCYLRCSLVFHGHILESVKVSQAHAEWVLASFLFLSTNAYTTLCVLLSKDTLLVICICVFYMHGFN